MKKLFGDINMTWIKVVVFAIITAVYTALINQVPFLKDTSFRDIAISFECWIFFAIIIIVNSKNNLDAALKTFVFFLISQPLIYLVEVPFLGWSIMGYYKNWILWTILTFPMAYVGYYMKKDNWFGLLVLVPMLVFLGLHFSNFLSGTIFYFPHHLLSAIFCIVTMAIYVLYIFKNKNIKIIGTLINVIIVAFAIFYTLSNPYVYKTTLLLSNVDNGLVFDESYDVYLKDKNHGNVYIYYENGIEEYAVGADFKRAGKTELVLISPDGVESVFQVDVKESKYDLNRIK